MIVVKKPLASDASVKQVIQTIEGKGLYAHLSAGKEFTDTESGAYAGAYLQPFDFTISPASWQAILPRICTIFAICAVCGHTKTRRRRTAPPRIFYSVSSASASSLDMVRPITLVG